MLAENHGPAVEPKVAERAAVALDREGAFADESHCFHRSWSCRFNPAQYNATDSGPRNQISEPDAIAAGYHASKQ